MKNMKKFISSLLATLVAFSSLLLMPIPTAMAASNICIWNGLTSNFWSNPANWTDCGGIAPETSDSLSFPSTTGFKAMNNDLNIISPTVTIDDTGYVFNGNPLKVVNTLGIYNSATFNVEVQFINSGVGATALLFIDAPATSTTFNDSLVLTLGPTTHMQIYTDAPILNLPTITGSAQSLYIRSTSPGSPTVNSATDASTFTAQLDIGGLNFVCRSNNCFGDSTNEVFLLGANIADPALRLDAASLILANPIEILLSGFTEQHAINVVQSATLNGSITTETYTGFIVASGKTLNINGPLSLYEDFYINGADLSSVVNINSVPILDNPAISLMVDSGKVLINSIAPLFPVIVTSNGKLGGSGGVGTTTIEAGGIFGAGESPGCMTLGSLTMTGTSIFEEELAGNVACTSYDQTTVTSTATLGGATLTIVPSYTPTIGQVFTILTAGAIVGEFAGLPNNSEITAGGITFRINYNSIIGGGKNVTLTVLSIPAVAPNTGLPITNTLPAILAILAGATIIGISSVQRSRHRKANKAKA